MKSKALFLKALNTLLFSWGCPTPNEAYWAANQFLDFYETEFNTTLGIRFEEEGNDEEILEKLEEEIGNGEDKTSGN